MKAQLIPDNWLQLMTPDDRKRLGRHGMTIQEIIDKTSVRSEKELQVQIVNLLRLKGIAVLWHRTDRRSAATIGWPDLTCAIQGQACAIEVKFEDGKLSEEQTLMLQKLEAFPNKWRCAVIRSIDEMLAFLRAFDL